ncbi:hypothetical protein PAPYR_5495 [Paratrimastix pyriformis]|uniref:Peroxisomal assembly protein PEX3 n=1 Tax=Paratrimastix pyriformis TaxID=342808 RepID=A0ABQ8UHP2_9EUKA|nr:hypothetical protein PAPYR_5495 [Paratrimastix pyriformis]
MKRPLRLLLLSGAALGAVVAGTWAYRKYHHKQSPRRIKDRPVVARLPNSTLLAFRATEKAGIAISCIKYPSLRKAIFSQLNTDVVMRQIGAAHESSEKDALYAELKTLCFARLVSALYSTTLTCITFRVQSSILARRLRQQQLSGAQVDTTPGSGITEGIQERYMEMLFAHFLENAQGLGLLVEQVRQAVRWVLQEVTLDHLTTLDECITLVEAIFTRLESLLGPDLPRPVSISTSPPPDVTATRGGGDAADGMRRAASTPVVLPTALPDREPRIPPVFRFIFPGRGTAPPPPATPAPPLPPVLQSLLRDTAEVLASEPLVSAFTMALRTGCAFVRLTLEAEFAKSAATSLLSEPTNPQMPWDLAAASHPPAPSTPSAAGVIPAAVAAAPRATYFEHLHATPELQKLSLMLFAPGFVDSAPLAH